MKPEDFSYKQIIQDSILIKSNTERPDKFVNAVFDSILFKGEIEEFNLQIDSLIEMVNDELYKKTYKEMSEIINSEIKVQDSVNLNEIRTTNLIVYPLYELARSGKLNVIDQNINEVQDSIWEKNFYGENLYQDSIKVRFYMGKLYATKSGKDFLRVELKSGH